MKYPLMGMASLEVSLTRNEWPMPRQKPGPRAEA